MSDLQGIVDALAATLDRPVGVDDRHYRALAYSAHPDGIDAVRVASILQRETPYAVRAWIESFGILEAEGFVRLPANPGLSMAARICLPIRFDGTVLGYLWLIDEPMALSDAELEQALRGAGELAIELYRLRRLEHDDRQSERELLRRIFSRTRSADPIAAGAELVGQGFLAAARAYAVLVLAASHPDGREAPDAVRVRLIAAAEQIRRGVAPRHLLLFAGAQVACVLACDPAEEVEQRAHALAVAAERSLADSPGWSVVVAVGDPLSSPQELHRAYEEAQLALFVAHAVGGFTSPIRWSELGAYRILAPLARDHDVAALLPLSLTRLLASADADTLVPTIERYLDLAGDARATAASLFVHRSSLYARLHRIEQVAGIDLRSGESRLKLHLGLRLWRLSGGGRSAF